MSLTAHVSETGETFLRQCACTSAEPQYRKYECNPSPPTPRLPCISPQSNANCRTTIQFVVKIELRCGVIHTHYSGDEHLGLGTASIQDTECSGHMINVALHLENFKYIHPNSTYPNSLQKMIRNPESLGSVPPLYERAVA